nr:PLP-dependent transferase [Halovivax limisalsi]
MRFDAYGTSTDGPAVGVVDATDLDAVEAAVDDRTKLVWLETPTSPLIRLCDVSAIADPPASTARWSASTTPSSVRTSSDRSISARTSSPTARRRT